MTIDYINQLFTTYGQQTYEEDCTQLQHAQQCGSLALQDTQDTELAIAAFLHDIGHFIAADKQLNGMDAYGFANHADLGADYLYTAGFSTRIVHLVREHVQAKRYLAAVDPQYLKKLSNASRVTLSQQSGPMSQQQVKDYRATPHLDDVIRLRLYDDGGKQPEMVTLPLAEWLRLIGEHLHQEQEYRIKEH